MIGSDEIEEAVQPNVLEVCGGSGWSEGLGEEEHLMDEGVVDGGGVRGWLLWAIPREYL
jgi:hypothetical protein